MENLDIKQIHQWGQDSATNSSVLELNDKPVAIALGPNVKLTDIAPYLPLPVRVKAVQNFIELRSFTEYVNRFKTANTQIFASLGKSVSAIIDYHSEANVADWGDHRAVYLLQPSADWLKWLEFNGKGMDQVEFSDFLEDQWASIETPDSATLQEIILKFSATSNVKFDSAINRTSGAVNITYVDDTQIKGNLKLPDRLELAVQPFKTAKPVQMLARLRFRVQQGAVKFTYVLDRPDKVLEDAFERVVTEIGELTEIVPYVCP